MGFSFRTKLILPTALAVGLFVFVTSVLTYRSLQKQEWEVEAHATSLGRMLAQLPVLQQPAEADSRQRLETALAAFCVLDGNIVFAVITDPKGGQLARYALPPGQGGPAPGDLNRLADRDYRGSTDWKLLDVHVENQAGVLQHHLRMAYSLADVRNRVLATAVRMLLVTLLLAAASVAAIAWLAGRLVQPLRQLTEAMRRMRAGVLGSTVDIASEDEMGELARAFNDMSTELRSRERLHSNFARFVSEAVARKVISDDRTVRLGGERRVVTVLFADIRGFTTFSEGRSPEEVVGLLNECFRALADVIPRYGGTVDKFIGDAMMADFNTPSALDEHEISAVMAGLDLHRVMNELNARRRAGGKDELRLGIGINTGEVLAGTFGSEQRLEYTVIGAPVNLAQRIESHARNGEMLLGETTYQAVRHLVEAVALDPVVLKGLDAPVRLYKVLGLRQQAEVKARSLRAASTSVEP